MLEQIKQVHQPAVIVIDFIDLHTEGVVPD
jgi:hypothetical protein